MSISIYTGQMYYRLILCMISAFLFYQTMLPEEDEIIFIEEDNIVESYIIKNSSKTPEDRTIMSDPEALQDYDHPGAYWLPSQEVYFTSAFLDTRYNVSTVRIIGMQHRGQKVAPRCKFKVGNLTTTVKSEVDFIFPYWPIRSFYLAALYHCDSPVITYTRTSIQVCSTDDLPCVKIPLNHPKHPEFRRKEVAICGKAYEGALDSRRLIEWLEINRLAGVSSVIMYDDGIRGWANQVIDYYKSINFVKTVSFPLLGLLKAHAVKHYKLSKEEYFSISQQTYLASLNDCLYRYLFRYEFFMIIDYDEVLLPARDESIYFLALRHTRMLPRLSGLTFYTGWHFTDFQKTSTPNISVGGLGDLYMLEHNRRSAIINNQPKSVVLANPVLSINWHAVIRNHPDSKYGLNALIKPTRDSAYIHHYRGRCIDKFPMTDCDDMLTQPDVDDVIPRYAERLRMRVGDIYSALGMRIP